MPKVLLVGYSGHRNFGDDLLLDQAYNYFKGISEIAIWTDVIGKESGYLDTWFPEATIIRNKTLGVKIFKHFDKVLYFGGGIFFDYRKNYPKTLFLRKTLSILKNFYLARMMGVRFAAIGIGLGPFFSNYSKFLNRLQLGVFDLIHVRDMISFNILEKYGMGEKISRGYDLSFLRYQFKNLVHTKDTKNILICPRKFNHSPVGDTYHNTLVKWAIKKKSQGFNVLVYGFQSYQDEKILDPYHESGLKTKIWNPESESLNEVLALFSSQDLIVSSRMHGIYIAGLVGRSSIGINVHPKVKDASFLFNRSKCLPIDFTLTQLDSAFSELITNNLREDDLITYYNSARNQYELARLWLNE
jgi:polysaccharide pyruvyl transferase WcaK-like protein